MPFSHFKNTVLNEEQIGEFQMYFDQGKLDNNKKLKPTEVQNLMRKTGLTVSNEDITRLFEEIDRTGEIMSNGLTFENFCEFCSRKVSDVHSTEDVLNAFQFFDPENTGYVSESFLREQLVKEGEIFLPDELKALISACKPDENGNIDYASFIDRFSKV